MESVEAFIRVIKGHSVKLQCEELKKSMQRELQEVNDMRLNLEQKKNILHNEMASLGFFMLKEKRAIKEKISIVETQLVKVPSEQTVKQDYQSRINQVMSQIK